MEQEIENYQTYCNSKLLWFLIKLEGHAVGRDAFVDHKMIVPLSELVSCYVKKMNWNAIFLDLKWTLKA